MNTYNVLVIGERPEEQMEMFNSLKKVEKYIKYYINDAKTIHDKTIQTLQLLIETNENNHYLLSYLDDIKDMTDIEYFSFVTKDLEHDMDGNAWDTSNPQGKWSKYTLGGSFSIPFITLENKSTFQAKKGDVNWDKLHLFNKELYANVWELVIEGKQPTNDNDNNILLKMNTHKDYLLSFCTKENYIIYNTSYWSYGVIKDGIWVDMDNKNSFEWVVNFYKTYVDPLDDNTQLTIFEYNLE